MNDSRYWNNYYAKKDILLIPTKAINTIDNKNFVQVEKKGRVEVEIWVSNSWKTEIISWLKAGDKLIIWELQANPKTNTNPQNSLINLPWTTRWMWWGWWFR